MDKLSIIDLLEYILESISVINRRFKGIDSLDDFMNTDEGNDKLDAISMRLQSIGEALKNIYRQDKNILEGVRDEAYWSEIIKLREIISHHYVDIDSEIIFDICENELEDLQKVIKEIISKCKIS